ncbi:MAG: hypothetical protein HWE34_05295 [Methylocystaceae bacterium]|nr:hypothetical protein [Methylocystaceae bacterium]
MADRIRKRTVFLKKVNFEHPKPNVTFEQYVRDTISIMGGVLPDYEKDFFLKMHCSDLSVSDNDGIFLYFTQTFEGSETSTVNKQNIGDRSVSTIQAPTGQDFLEQDLSVLIYKDNLITCSSGLSSSALLNYFYQVFKKSNLDNEVGVFGITNVAHTDQLKLIEDVGVKNIDLDVQTYLATFEEIKGTPEKNFLKTLFKKEDPYIARHKENMRARIILNPKKGLSKFSRDDMQIPLKRLAHSIVEDHDDEYKITLENGATLSPNDIKVHEKISLPAFGNSVDHKNVWQELKRIFEKYKNDQSII